MTRDEFISQHLAVCTAGRCKQYDPRKREVTYHTLAYSRRKCAKALWRRRKREDAA
jgi:hypothetical protein